MVLLTAAFTKVEISVFWFTYGPVSYNLSSKTLLEILKEKPKTWGTKVALFCKFKQIK